MGNWEEEIDERTGAKRNGARGFSFSPSPHFFSLSSARPFPLPSFPFDELAWIFDLTAKEETVLQSTQTLAKGRWGFQLTGA